MTSPPEPLIQIQNNFTEMILMMPSTKLHKWLRSFEQRGSQSPILEISLNKSPPEPLVQIQNIFTEMFLIMPSTKIAQMVLL